MICENCMKPCKHGNIKQCGDWEPIKTNGDRIRAMSNEELAEYQIKRVDDCPDVIRSDAPCLVKNNVETHSDCKQCWLDWLNSPAEKENNNE